MSNCGDLALISVVRPRHAAGCCVRGADRITRRPWRSADGRACHFPADWDLDPEIVGAEAVYSQLRAWMKSATPENAVMDPDELTEMPRRP